MPPSSSEFNPVEKLWAQLKKDWRKIIVTRDPSVATSKLWMVNNIIDVSRRWTEDKESIKRISKSHYSYMRQFMQEWNQNNVRQDRDDLLSGQNEVQNIEYV